MMIAFDLCLAVVAVEITSAFEAARLEDLIREARVMTSLGVPGADVRAPRVASFRERAINAADSDKEAQNAYLAKW